MGSDLDTTGKSARFEQGAPSAGWVDLAPVGNTPLVRLKRVTPLDTRAQLLVKVEWVNPGGSVKDRPALWMIRDAEARGLLGEGKSILDSTSGNTGIALAQIGAALGYRVTLCMPANASSLRKNLLQRLGATLILTDPLEGDDGAREVAARLAVEEPERYVYLDQYGNPMNSLAHYEGTAAEIWRQTAGRVTHFLAVAGSGGTFTGTSRRLKELNPAVQCILVQPDLAYHGIEGTKHYASSRVPDIFDRSLVSRQIDVSTEEAQDMARRLSEEEGLPTGVSGGASVAAAVRLAEETSDGLIVTVLPDSIMKALGSEPEEERE